MDRYRRAIEQVKKAVLDSFGVTELFDEVIDEHDLVDVVRCKDCKWFGEYSDEYKAIICKDGMCGNPRFDLAHNIVSNWFCADGERKEQRDE